jgi:preprotein translocase SecE subunit
MTALNDNKASGASHLSPVADKPVKKGGIGARIKQLIQFFKDARLEIRKVVWPTRQETLQATLMVLVAVVVMAILLWLVDMALFRVINFLTT